MLYLRAVESESTKATSPQEGEKETTTQGNRFKDPFLGRERPGNSRTEHLLKQPVGYKSRLNGRVFKVGERHQGRIVKWCLMDIHPHHGPRTVNINRWAEQKLREMRARKRRERSSEKRGSKWTRMIANRSKERKEHLTGKARKKEKERWRRKVNQKFSRRTNRDSKVITWNLQRCKIQVDGRGRIQHILATVQENKWDIVLLSEISSKEGSMVVRRGLSSNPWEKSRYYLKKPLGPRVEEAREPNMIGRTSSHGYSEQRQVDRSLPASIAE